MALLKELLSDWVGLLSLITILAVMVMAGYYAWLFTHKVEQDTRARAVSAPRRRRRA